MAGKRDLESAWELGYHGPGIAALEGRTGDLT